MTKSHTSSGTDDHLTAPDVRQRAVIGAVVDALRGIGIRVVGLLGTAVTARLLTPYDFGLVAFGATILMFGSFLSDGGVGTALIRRAEPPERSELQALVAFQLGLDLLLVVGTTIVMLPFGLLGQVTTVVVFSLPFGAVRAPSYIIYERRLNYRPMAIVELVETSAYYVWAIATISIGWGVWGLATAAVVRAMLGSTLLLVLLPEGRVLPVPSYTKIRALLGFGFRYQAVGIAAVASRSGREHRGRFGRWSRGSRAVERRLADPSDPVLVLRRTLARLVPRNVEARCRRRGRGRHDRARDRSRRRRDRSAGRPARRVRLGVDTRAHRSKVGRWLASAIPPSCLAMVFGVPISVALAGYLWAIGAASIPLRATLVGIPAMAVVLAAAAPRYRRDRRRACVLASALVESVLFVHGARRTVSFKIGNRLAAPVLLATVVGIVRLARCALDRS